MSVSAKSSPAILNLLRVLIGAALVVVAIELVLICWPTAGLLGLKLIGRNRCSIDETLSSQQLGEAQSRMLKRSRLVSRDGSCQLWDTPRGQFWLAVPLDGLFAHVLAEQELRIQRDGKRGVHPGDIVLDCGADYGTITRLALSMGAKLVVAIEAAPYKEPCLKRTFAREIADGRVIVVPKGVWDREDQLTLHGDSIVMERTGRSVTVPLTTIDKIVAELQLPRVDFINMDIEGAERKALAGARTTLARFRPRMAIASEHYSDDADTIPKSVRAMVPNYSVFCARCLPSGRHQVLPELLFFAVP